MAWLRFALLVSLFFWTVTRVEAAPFVDIRALVYVGASSWYPPSTGISLGCYGDATGTDSCALSASLYSTVSTSTTLTANASGGVVITNTTDHVINDWLTLATDESAFNPGGPGVGIGIADALTQGARFRSSVSGMGVGDSHSCAIGIFGNEGTLFSPTTCGVGSPDSSPGSFSIELNGFDPGEQMFLPYSVSITAEFTMPPPANVPTPGSAWMLLAGLASLACAGRRVILQRGS